jgi:hypothetical protein
MRRQPPTRDDEGLAHDLTWMFLSPRLQLERDGSPIKVFEFMALFDGMEREELELHVGITEDIYQALRRSPDAAVCAVNAATGG